MTTTNLSMINIYPIKSTGGVSLSNAWVDDYGLSCDRRFVITTPEGEFITARTEPSLCLIQASITANGLIVTAPNMPPLKINYQAFSQAYKKINIWQDTIDAQHCSENYDNWFSRYLNKPCHLYYFGQQSNRPVKGYPQEVSFADGYPLLLISQASLDDLNSRLKSPVTMAQFRPNIVVSSTQAYAEDTWQHFRIGEVEFKVVKPCSRCIFTTVNPETGKKHVQQQPLATLKHYRQVANGEVMFGQNVIALNQGQIKQGDEVEVLSTQAPLSFVHQSDTKDSIVDKEASAPPPSKTVNLSFDSWNTQHRGNNQEPILDQGEAAGLILPYSCRGGMCGRCKIKLKQGDVKQLADDGLTEEEKTQGYVLACSSIPQSDLVLTKD